jgi:hypothetical protein
VKEINVVGHHMGIPNIILPKPAVSINIAKPTKPAGTQNNIKFNGGSHGVSARGFLLEGFKDCRE